MGDLFGHRRRPLGADDDVERISAWLDAYPKLLDGVADDLGAGASTVTYENIEPTNQCYPCPSWFCHHVWRTHPTRL